MYHKLFFLDFRNLSIFHITYVKITLMNHVLKYFSSFLSVCSTMAKGIFALFGVTNVTSLSTVKSYCNTFHMPYVTPSAPVNDSDEPGFLLKMRPSYDRAMIDIIKHHRWTRIYYIYDTQEGKLVDDFQSTHFSALGEESCICTPPVFLSFFLDIL